MALGNILRLVGVAVVVIGAIAAALLHMAPAWVPVAYLMLGIVSFGVYGFDKRAARRGEWRVSEGSLHGIDLIGGIAGGLLGQVVFRHKTRKEGFVAVTTLVVGVHIAALALLVAGIWRFPEMLFVG